MDACKSPNLSIIALYASQNSSKSRSPCFCSESRGAVEGELWRQLCVHVRVLLLAHRSIHLELLDDFARYLAQLMLAARPDRPRCSFDCIILISSSFANVMDAS